MGAAASSSDSEVGRRSLRFGSGALAQALFPRPAGQADVDVMAVPRAPEAGNSMSTLPDLDIDIDPAAGQRAYSRAAAAAAASASQHAHAAAAAHDVDLIQSTPIDTGAAENFAGRNSPHMHSPSPLDAYGVRASYVPRHKRLFLPYIFVFTAPLSLFTLLVRRHFLPRLF